MLYKLTRLPLILFMSHTLILAVSTVNCVLVLEVSLMVAIILLYSQFANDALRSGRAFKMKNL